MGYMPPGEYGGYPYPYPYGAQGGHPGYPGSFPVYDPSMMYYFYRCDACSNELKQILFNPCGHSW